MHLDALDVQVLAHGTVAVEEEVVDAGLVGWQVHDAAQVSHGAPQGSSAPEIGGPQFVNLRQRNACNESSADSRSFGAFQHVGHRAGPYTVLRHPEHGLASATGTRIRAMLIWDADMTRTSHSRLVLAPENECPGCR